MRETPHTGSTIEGKLQTTSRGVGYLSYDEEAKDIEIPEDKTYTALHGDTVVVRITHSDSERVYGEVIKVLERGAKLFSGTLEQEAGHFFLMTDNHRIHRDILVAPDERLKEGYKAVVRFLSWNTTHDDPKGELVSILGRKGEHEAEMQSIIVGRGIVYDFPVEVEKEAKEIKANEAKIFQDAENDPRRKDIRDIPTFTIDPDSAKDFDDALSIRTLQNGNLEIGIHIADVSHYVQEGSALDQEAQSRGFSTYLVDRTIPMLPEVLSNDLCSLNPHVDRLAFSAIFEMTHSGQVESSWYGKTIIHSDKRFTYENAQEQIDAGDGEYSEPLITLNGIAKTLRARRFSKGAVDFSDDEVKFELNDKGEVMRVYKKERLDTHKLVEEFMLLANRSVAEKIEKLCENSGHDHLFVYRIHDLPDREKLSELGTFLKALGYRFEVPNEVSGTDLNKLLEQVKDKPEEGLVNTALIRSMAKAVYSTANNGHFGLAFEHYTHFTSPIRRYPDLIVHRLLFAHLHNENITQREIDLYESIISKSTDKEINIMQAERESIKYKQVEFLKDRVGETFDVLVTGVSDFGLFVEEKETRAQGLIAIRNLGNDFFELREKQFAIVGKSSGQKFTLGQTLKAKLTGADLDKRQLDFRLQN